MLLDLRVIGVSFVVIVVVVFLSDLLVEWARLYGACDGGVILPLAQ